MKILACIDTSAHAEEVLRHAAWTATRMDVPVEVLHAIERPTRVSSTDYSGRLGIDSREALMAQLADLDEKRNRLAQEGGRQLLESAVSFLHEEGVQEVTQRLVHGSLADHMREYDKSARLIIVGKRGESAGTEPDHLGINLERIIRASKRPVLVTSGPFRPVERFVIAFDGGPTTGKAIDMLVNQPLLKDAVADVLMVGDATPSRAQQVADAAGRLRQSGYTVNEEIISGTPEDVIPEHITKTGAGLLVMGAYGHSRIRAWVVGSTTTELLRKSTTPLLIMR